LSREENKSTFEDPRGLKEWVLEGSIACKFFLKTYERIESIGPIRYFLLAALTALLVLQIFLVS